MKLTKYIPAQAVALATGLAALTLGQTAIGAENIYHRFDEASQATFSRWWGAASQVYEFDASKDAGGSASSGSQKMTIGFDLATHGGDNQFAAQFVTAAFNGTEYTNMTFDLQFDPASPVSNGNYGNLEYGLIEGFNQITLGSVAIPAGTAGWTQVAARIDPATPALESLRGFWFKIWSGNAGGLTGTSTIWIDNITLNANTNSAPIPPFPIAITKANPGLRVFASAPGAQYQRQNVYTRASTGYSWVGSASPVTYSLTVADYPSGTNYGFQTHLFLVPGSNLPDWLNSPDWNQPHLIFLDIGNNADGTGYASFRYKTNLPNGNTMVYNATNVANPIGTLASIGSPTPNGTWSITFNNNTEVTMTAPNGAVTNFALPADAAALFADPLHVYAGAQPNRLENIGQSVTFKRIQITGVASPVDETFSDPGVLGGPTWGTAAVDRAGLVVVPSDAVFWLSWPLPDTGWVLQWAEDLESNFWNDSTFSGSVNIGGRRQTLVRQPDLPPSFLGNYFFQMIRR